MYQIRITNIEPFNGREKEIENKIIYLYKNFAYYKCPCGCGELRVLFINNKEKPSWQLDKNTTTITPSILHNQGCKSHYFIRNGEIVWC